MVANFNYSAKIFIDRCNDFWNLRYCSIYSD